MITFNQRRMSSMEKRENPHIKSGGPKVDNPFSPKSGGVKSEFMFKCSPFSNFSFFAVRNSDFSFPHTPAVRKCTTLISQFLLAENLKQCFGPNQISKFLLTEK